MKPLKIHPDTGLKYRSGDLAIYRSMEKYSSMPISKGDKVFDLGAHVGFFVDLALRRGASEVVAFEPEAGNFQVLQENFGEHPQVKLVQVAIVEDGSSKTVTLYRKGNASTHNLLGKQKTPMSSKVSEAIEVPALGFLEMFQRFGPCSVLKANIEGSEFLLPWDTLPDQIKAVAIEMHVWRKIWRNKKGPEILSTMQQLEFSTIEKPDFTVPWHTWHTMGIWQR